MVLHLLQKMIFSKNNTICHAPTVAPPAPSESVISWKKTVFPPRKYPYIGKFRLLFVILSLLITSGCSSQGEDSYHQEALLARTAYLSLQNATAVCELTADYGERVYDYTMVLSVSQENGSFHSSLQLTAPELLSGIAVSQEGFGKESTLQWEDMILETGDLSDNGFTPMTAIPLLLETLCSGYLETVTLKSNGVLELYSRNPDIPLGQGQEVTLWLSPDSYALLGGEIFQEGQRVISVEIHNFQMS